MFVRITQKAFTNRAHHQLTLEFRLLLQFILTFLLAEQREVYPALAVCESKPLCNEFPPIARSYGWKTAAIMIGYHKTKRMHYLVDPTLFTYNYFILDIVMDRN
jgi:hypothetical protein